MTRDRLLEHHIIVIESFDRKLMEYYHNLGFKFLYLDKHTNVPFLVTLVHNYGCYYPRLKDKFKCITKDKLATLPIWFERDMLMHNVKSNSATFTKRVYTIDLNFTRPSYY